MLEGGDSKANESKSCDLLGGGGAFFREEGELGGSGAGVFRDDLVCGK